MVHAILELNRDGAFEKEHPHQQFYWAMTCIWAKLLDHMGVLGPTTKLSAGLVVSTSLCKLDQGLSLYFEFVPQEVAVVAVEGISTFFMKQTSSILLP